MSLDRRVFLRRLLLGGAAISQANLLDPDFWKWVPGAVTHIEVPALVMPTFAQVVTYGYTKLESGNVGFKPIQLMSPVLQQFGISRRVVVPNSSLRLADRPGDTAIGVRQWDYKLVTLVDGPAPKPGKILYEGEVRDLLVPAECEVPSR